MRIYPNIILGLLFCFQLSAQDQIKKEFNNQSLKSVLELYSTTYKLTFAYDADKLNSIVINKKIEASSISELIEKTFEDLPFTFKIIDNIYLILHDDNKILVIEPQKEQNDSINVEKPESLPTTDNTYLPEKRTRIKVDTLHYSQMTSDSISIDNTSITEISLSFPTNYKIEEIDSSSENMYSAYTDNFDIQNLNINYFGQNDPLYALNFYSSINTNQEDFSSVYYNNSISSNPIIHIEGIPIFDLSQMFGAFSLLNNSSFTSVEVEEFSTSINFKNDYQYDPKKNLDVKFLQNLINSDLIINYQVHKNLNISTKLRKSINNGLSFSLAERLYNTSMYQLNDSIIQVNNRSFKTNNISQISTDFFDVLTIIDLNIKEHKFRLSGIYSKDIFQIKEDPNIFQDFVLQEKIKSNLGISLSWDKKWNRKFNSSLFIYYSQFYNQLKLDQRQLNPVWMQYEIQTDLNYLQLFQTNFNLNYALNPTNKLSAEIKTDFLYSNFNVSNGLYYDVLEKNTLIPISLILSHHHSSDFQSFKYGSEIKILNKEVYMLPFIKGSFQMNDSYFGIIYNYSLEFLNKDYSIGSNFDPIPVFNYSENPTNKSHNFKLEYFKPINESIKIKIISKYQIISELKQIIEVQDEDFKVNFVSFDGGLARNITIGITGIYKNDWLKSITSYNQSNIDFSFNNLNSGAFFNHSLFPSNDFKTYNELIFRNFAFNVNWILQANKNYFSPLGKHYLLISEGEYSSLINEKNQNTNVLPAYHRLDLSFTYHLKTRKSHFSFSISLYNVYNRKNILFTKFEPIDFIHTSLGEVIPVYKTNHFYSKPIIPSVKFAIHF